MRFVFYTHSLVSDWNHGNAHFLRGVMRELTARGHHAEALEPAHSWSRSNLLRDHGPTAIERFHWDFPMLQSTSYDNGFDHEAALAGADVVVVHEWTEPALVAEIGSIRRRGGSFTLMFHDTHHRAVSDEGAIAELVLADYDGVLAFGETLRERYLARGWGRQVFTWHEAADTALFRPIEADPEGELVWIGNWGDGERERELAEFLVGPATELGLTGSVYGVRYPKVALDALARSPLAYRGYMANADVPITFARHKMTVHVPRRPYVQSLLGIPTIRVFEALACGIPLVCAPWSDAEGLFRPGDFLTAADGAAMTERLTSLRGDPALRADIATKGLDTIRRRHTCGHRADELLAIVDRLRPTSSEIAHEEVT
jgi:spore maturation protein CgeB